MPERSLQIATNLFMFSLKLNLKIDIKKIKFPRLRINTFGFGRHGHLAWDFGNFIPTFPDISKFLSIRGSTKHNYCYWFKF